MNIYEAISSLVFYGEKEGLIEKEDEIYTRNRIMTVLSLDSFEDAEPKKDAELEDILGNITIRRRKRALRKLGSLPRPV